MTLAPCAPGDLSTDPRGYSWVDVPGQERTCCAPGCPVDWGLETHHVVRRSMTGGPQRWVTVQGVVLLNERRLCQRHHLEVTGTLGGHRAWIRWVAGQGWVWYSPAPSGGPGCVQGKTGWWCPVGPLKEVPCQ